VPALWQALAHDALKRLDQVADHPQFPKAKAGVGVQFVAAVHGARQDRERGLDRFDKTWVAQALGCRVAIARGQARKAAIGIGAGLCHDFARVQLVLAGQHRIDRRARPAHALGQQGRSQRAKLLVVGDHGGPAAPLGLARQPLDKTRHVKPGQMRVAGKAEQIEAGHIVRPGLGALRAKPARSQS
jgi:hypothetical protein